MRRSRLSVLPAVLALAAGLALGPAPDARAATTTARSLLSKLVVAAEAGSTTYDRTYFKHWVDANGDCQNTRAEVLIAESQVSPTYTSSSRCTVSKGRWRSYYDGATWTLASDVDIDHVVALKEAWESGARSWTAYDRQRYANDLGMAASLIAVTDNVNQSKGDRDPAEWLPPLASARCGYAIWWVQVKYRWRLTLNSTEKSRLASLFSGSCGDRTVAIPTRAR